MALGPSGLGGVSATGQYALMMSDDISVPLHDASGQPALELLRQVVDASGVYDRRTWFWRQVQDTALLATATVHSDVILFDASRSKKCLPPRLLRHLLPLYMPEWSKLSLVDVFGTILGKFITNNSRGNGGTTPLYKVCAMATASLFLLCRETFRPSPGNSFHTFSVRDIARVVQGLSFARSTCLNEANLPKIWAHEVTRCFQDKLEGDNQQDQFSKLLGDLLQRHFKTDWHPEQDNAPLRYGWVFASTETRPYDRMQDEHALLRALQEFLHDYDSRAMIDGSSSTPLRLVMVEEVVHHLCRILRVCRLYCGHILLVGLAGSGRRSICTLAAHTIEAVRCTAPESWPPGKFTGADLRTLVKSIYRTCGVTDQNCMLILADDELHDGTVRDILSTLVDLSHVPQLCSAEEVDNMLREARSLWEDLIPRGPQQNFGASAAARKGIVLQGTPTDMPQHEQQLLMKQKAWHRFLQRLRDRLHVMLCVSPLDSEFRRMLLQTPALISCCTVLHMRPWPVESLRALAAARLSEELTALPQNTPAVTGALANDLLLAACAARLASGIHEEKAQVGKVQGSSFCSSTFTLTARAQAQVVRVFAQIIREKVNQAVQEKERFSSGLARLRSTAQLLADLEEGIATFRRMIAQHKADMKDLEAKVKEKNAHLNNVQAELDAERGVQKMQEAKLEELQQEVRASLDTVLPDYRSAVKAVEKIDKKDIQDLKSFQSAPPLLLMVMECICLLFGCSIDWLAAKSLISENGFVKRFKDFDKDNIQESIISRVRANVRRDDFDPNLLESISKAGKCFSQWCRALVSYDEVLRGISPKREELKKVEADFRTTQQSLRKLQKDIASCETQAGEPLQLLHQVKRELQNSEQEEEAAKQRLTLAYQLLRAQPAPDSEEGETPALLSYEHLWSRRLDGIAPRTFTLPGDALLAAACLCLLGHEPSAQRERIQQRWILLWREQGLPLSTGEQGSGRQESKGTSSGVKTSETSAPSQDAMMLGERGQDGIYDFSDSLKAASDWKLVDFLLEPNILREWLALGLADEASAIDNALIVDRSPSWPLCLDPHMQAHQWLKNMAATKGLQVVHCACPNLEDALAACMSSGTPLLVSDCSEELPLALDWLLRLGKEGVAKTWQSHGRHGPQHTDSRVVNQGFALYMTTRAPRLNLPEGMRALLTVVDFSVTLKSIKDQFLCQVASRGSPEAWARLNDISRSAAQMQRESLMLEEQVLSLIVDNTANLLEQDALMSELIDTTERCATLKAESAEQRETAQFLKSDVEAAYRPLVDRYALLFVAVASLSDSLGPAFACALPDVLKLAGAAAESTLRITKPVSTAVVSVLGLLAANTKSSEEEEPPPFLPGDSLRDGSKDLGTATQRLFKSLAKGYSRFHRQVLLLHFALMLSEERGEITASQRGFVLGRSSLPLLDPDRLDPELSKMQSPDIQIFPEETWRRILQLAQFQPLQFGALPKHICQNLEEWTAAMAAQPGAKSTTQGYPDPWGEGHGCDGEPLKRFEQVLLVRAVQPLHLPQELEMFAQEVLEPFGEQAKDDHKLATADTDDDGLLQLLRSCMDLSQSGSKGDASAKESKAGRRGSLRTKVRAELADASWKVPRPLLFLIAPGCNPAPYLAALAAAEPAPGTGFKKQELKVVSLGRSQVSSNAASLAIQEAFQMGKWLLLENLQLVPSWLLQLDYLLDSILTEDTSEKKEGRPSLPGFRLFLATLPFPMPATLALRCDRLAWEMPQGASALLKRCAKTRPAVFAAANGSEEEQFAQAVLEDELIALTRFHSKLMKDGTHQEGDLEAALFSLQEILTLPSFTTAQERWAATKTHALSYFLAEVDYGGVTPSELGRQWLAALFENFIGRQTGSVKDTEGPLPTSSVSNSLDHAVVSLGRVAYSEEPARYQEASKASVKLLAWLNLAHDNLESTGQVLTTHDGTSLFHPRGRCLEEAQGVAAGILEDLPMTSALQDPKQDEKEMPTGCLESCINLEIKHLDSLLQLVRSSLEALVGFLRGDYSAAAFAETWNRFPVLVALDEAQALTSALVNNVVPELWLASTYQEPAHAGRRALASWLKDVRQRAVWLRRWEKSGKIPSCIYLNRLFNPRGFLASVLHNHARRIEAPPEKMTFVHKPELALDTEDEVNKQMASQAAANYSGIYVAGLFLDGADWNRQKLQLEERLGLAQRWTPMPAIYLQPTTDSIAGNAELADAEAAASPKPPPKQVDPVSSVRRRSGAGDGMPTAKAIQRRASKAQEPPPEVYACPLLQSACDSLRTCQQTPLCSVALPAALPPSHWLLRDTALIVSISD
eukprot:TRINITY_DN14937_c0_g1_i1.p1 TRINITY_DN14937_c0_g1~~TRINITY_DN14937_c0_g1_i1.p1  ORF type:complete len:2664 (-),score=482.78 TRINITY_DN14937_c0_g1_i1:99-7019(-)